MLQHGPHDLRPATFALPTIGEDDGLLSIEACGLCGTDLEQYSGAVATQLGLQYPIIPGHEIVGRIVELGARASARWGVVVGDRVAVEPSLKCGRCRGCLAGRACGRHGLSIYGLIPSERPPAIWGGYADHLYLHADSVLHPLPEHVSSEVAVLFNPLANAIEWSVILPSTQIGASALILGAGQRGLCCIAALRSRGAGPIIVTGLSRDAHKLELALQLGATAVVDVEQHDVGSVVKDMTGGELVDIAIDTTPHSLQALGDAIRLVRPGGYVVLGGVKHAPMPEFMPDELIIRDLTLRGGNSASSRAYGQAVEMIAGTPSSLAPLHTHSFPMDQADVALHTLAGDHGPAIAVCLRA